MIDTGAQPNVVKIAALKNRKDIDRSKRPHLHGISETKVHSIETILLYLDDLKAFAKFIVFPNLFPLRTHLLIGSQFCKSCNMMLDYGRAVLTFNESQFALEEERTVECPARDLIYIEMKVSEALLAK